jgi:hypothetical protein
MVIRDGPNFGARRRLTPALDQVRWRLLREATPIIADSVYDFYAEHHEPFERKEGGVVLKDTADVRFGDRKLKVSTGLTLTNLAPPFDNFFVEWRDGLTHDIHEFFGVHFYAFPNSVYPFDLEVERQKREWLRDKQWKWMYVAELYQSVNATGRTLGPFLGQVMFIPEDGDNARSIYRHYPEFTNNDAQYLMFVSRLDIGWLSVNMMHGETVRVTAGERPEGWAKNYQKRNGQPPIKYKVLDIHAVQEVLERDGNVSKTGITHALHVCRGHFRRYESGKVVWIDEHERGDASKGRVEKKYNVVP